MSGTPLPFPSLRMIQDVIIHKKHGRGQGAADFRTRLPQRKSAARLRPTRVYADFGKLPRQPLPSSCPKASGRSAESQPLRRGVSHRADEPLILSSSFQRPLPTGKLVEVAERIAHAGKTSASPISTNSCFSFSRTCRLASTPPIRE
jgi:hypothetical protein